MQNNSSTKTNSIIRERKIGLSSFELMFIVFFSFYFLFPIVNYIIPLFFALAIFMLYLFYLLAKGTKESYFAIKITFIAFIISLLYLILTETATIGNVSNRGIKRFASKFYQIAFNFLPAILFIRVSRLANKKQIKTILFISFILFIYVILKTTMKLAFNESATRDWTQFEEQSKENVGTYAYIYAVTIIIVTLTGLFYKIKKAPFKALVITTILCLLVFLLFAQYTLALLIAMIGIVIQIGKNIKDVRKRIMLYLTLIVFIILMPYIFNFIANIVPSRQMSIRLKEVASFFGSGDTSGYNLGSRLSLYKKTIQAFLSSPILGNKQLGFDGHATFLTVFADIGFIGGTLFIYPFILAKKQIAYRLNKAQLKSFIPIFICLVLMGLTNPIHSAQPLSFAIWFLAPLMFKLFIAQEEEL